MLRNSLLLLLVSWTILMGVDRRAYAQEKMARLTREIRPPHWQRKAAPHRSRHLILRQTGVR